MLIKTQIKYLTVYLTLNVPAVLVAYEYWWTDSFTLSSLSKESLMLILCVGLAWIGILYLSIFIIRRFIIRDESSGFIGPIDLSSNEFQEGLGVEVGKKFKNYLSLIAFPILITTILLFILSMKYYGKFQLKNNGKVEIVTVRNIIQGNKGKHYVYFECGNKRHFYLLNKGYKAGDKIEIKYAKDNPGILDYNTEENFS